MTICNTENTMEVRELNKAEMSEISGGTFTRNTYRESGYHSVGISTSYHFFDKDEFKFMGKSISYEKANKIVKIADGVLEAMNNGCHGANQVNTTDQAFQRAFNSQLFLEFGIVWDGKPGTSF